MTLGLVPAAWIPASADQEEPAPPDAGWHFLPDSRIFSPLLADPRWPHFSLSYGRRIHQGFPPYRDAAMISLGEHIGMVEYITETGTRFGVGLQPAVFGLFNLDDPSRLLVNADYRLGVPFDFRSGPFSLEASIMHQSSHLGDEIVLEIPVERVNLSYESALVTVSYEAGDFRVYAGGGTMVHSVPADLKPWSAWQGVEWSSRDGRSFGPVAAVHLEEREETEWEPAVSVRAGVEFVDPKRPRRRFQILVEYFRGHDPNGQFFRNRIESLGLGIHFYF